MEGNNEEFVDVEGAEPAASHALLLFLRGAGVSDASVVAAVLTKEQLHDEGSFLGLDSDDIVELM
eukprot:COSAG05_NODE_22530_length_264_cov_0.630303_1_plen_64_part_01